MELQTLQKQIIKESKNRLELAKEVISLKKEIIKSSIQASIRFSALIQASINFISSFDSTQASTQLHLKLRFIFTLPLTFKFILNLQNPVLKQWINHGLHSHKPHMNINTVDHAEDEFMVIACDGIWLIFFQVLGFCLLGLLSHFSLRHLLLSLMLGPFIDS
ncbi:hypothetical protein P8452_28677 [Trifolium repens]|nr:hypothetical protein P8452_28677 [Trifolium repens]